MSWSGMPGGVWLGVALFALAASSCNRPDTSSEDGGMQPASHEPDPDPSGSQTDAEVPARDGGGTMPPRFMPPTIVPSSICALSVGAECDGAEDCGDGQVCCGEFAPERFSYTRIACADSCDADEEFPLCHAGESCPGSGVCRRSLIIPFDFIGVCASPAETPELAAVPAVAGEVACGADRCEVGVTKCCLRMRFDFAQRLPVALEPYCAELDDDCDCTAVPPPVSGDEDGGS